MPQSGMGLRLKIGSNYIAEITSVGEFGTSTDMIEVTNYDSGGNKEFIPGLRDGGEIPIEGTFKPSDTSGQKAMYDAQTNATKNTFTIIMPSAMGAEFSFDAYVKDFKVSPPMDDKIAFSATLKVTGAITMGLTASAGLSALAMAGTGGTLSPAFANGTYYYTFGGVTAASVTITATAASHTLKLYIDDVYSQDLTSGSPSAAIAMAIGSKLLTVLSYESGKTQKIYEVVVVKTA